MEPFVGEIRPLAFNFAPRGWALCNGQTLNITQNQQLFAVIGTRYGGDGRTTFGLPNLTGGRTVIGAGAGRGLTPHGVGETGGTPAVVLQANQVPGHTHSMFGTSEPADVSTPTATAALGRTTGKGAYAPANGQLTQLSPNAVAPANGGGQPHNNLMPFQVLNYCISLQGIFPPHP
jgi:microcystin-dependent protein